jgi:hypothetical protein
MQYGLNAKTQRRQGAGSGSKISSLNNAYLLVTLTGIGRILFASLSLRAFALKSSWPINEAFGLFRIILCYARKTIL